MIRQAGPGPAAASTPDPCGGGPAPRGLPRPGGCTGAARPPRPASALAASLSLLSLLSLGPQVACTPPPAGDRASAARAERPSKEALFGDPSLVPTREGERARVEIALARTIEEHLAEDPQLAAVRAHVTAPAAGPAQVLISFRGPEAGAKAQEERARRIALGILGDRPAQVTIDRVELPPGAQEHAPAQERPLLNLALVLALLALGASAGVSLDRLRRRRSRS